MLKKIVIIGPESTGKSTLCAQLARHYKTLWCPEYARAYLLENGTDYTFDNLATIARGQLQLEDTYEKKVLKDNRIANKMLFVDTNMYVMKVWCEFVFQKVHPFILEEIAQRKYDLYLLCNIDLPWVKDELREYPDLQTRQQLFNIYYQILKQQTTPFSVISGNADERLNNALAVINSRV